MGLPALRIGDMHVCPQMIPGPVPIPHVGGPIIGPGAPTVLIGGMPAARLSDMAVCVGPPDAIMSGAENVLIEGMPAANMSSAFEHGGSAASCCPTVLLG